MVNIYINRETDNTLYDHLSVGESCYIYGPFQTGKTRLIDETKRKLQNFENGTIQSAIICFQDFTLSDENRKKERECYRCFIDHLAGQIRNTNGQLVSESENYRNYRNKFQNKLRCFLTGQWIRDFWENVLLRETEGNVVIFIDEADILFDETHFAHCFPENLLRDINSCVGQRQFAGRITFAIFSRQKSDNLKNRHKNQLSSLFNEGEEVDVDNFETGNLQQSEVQNLISNQLDHENPLARLEYCSTIVNSIFDFTKGQPFLTYEVLTCFIENSTFPISLERGRNIINGITDLESQDFVERESVKTHIENISNSFPEDDGLLSLYEKILNQSEIPYTQNAKTAKLLSLGLVRRERERERGRDQLTIHNPIYEREFGHDWINETRERIREFLENKETRINKIIEKITPILLILADIFSILGTVYFLNTSLPWQFLGIVFLLFAMFISGFLLVGYLKTNWARKIIEKIEILFPIISRKIKLNLTIKNLVILILIIFLAILGHFLITCSVLNQKGNKNLLEWNKADKTQPILILKDAFKNAENFKSIYSLNNVPVLRRAIPTSPLLTLQKINDEIKKKNQFKYSDDENITTIASFPNSKKIVTGGANGTLKIWDSSRELNDETKFTQKTEQEPISSLSVSSDGEIIATGGKNGLVLLWDGSEDGDFGLLQRLECQDEDDGRTDLTVTNVIFSNEIDDESYAMNKNYYLAAGTREGDLCIWKGYEQNFELVKKTKLVNSENSNVPKNIKKLIFSNDIKKIAIATEDGLIEFREIPELNFIELIKPYDEIAGNNDYLLDFNFNKDGSQIIASGKNPKVKILEWEAYQNEQANKSIQEWEVYQNSDDNPFISVRFGFDTQSSNNRQIAVVKTQDKLKFLDLKTGEVCKTAYKLEEDCPQPKELEIKDSEIKNVTYGSIQSKSGKQEFITTLEKQGENTYVTTWQINPKSPFQKNTLNLPAQDSIKGIEIRRRKEEGSYYIMSLTKDSRVEIWDQNIHRETHFIRCSPDPYVSVKFLPDESEWVTLSKNGLIKFWNFEPGDCVDDLNPIKIPITEQEPKFPNQLALSSQNNLMAVAYNNANQVLLRNRKEYKGNISTEAPVKFMSFSRDGKYLLVAGDSYGSLWDVSDVNNLQNMRPGDGKYLTLSSEENKLNIRGSISNISFTPKGNVAIAATQEHKIFKWNTSGKELKHFDFQKKIDQLKYYNKGIIQPEGIDNFSFSQDRPFLAVVFHKDELPVIQIWDWDKEQLIAQFKSNLKVINAVKFNPEGDLIVVGGERKQNGKPGEVFELHDLDKLLEDSCVWLKDYHVTHESEVKSICKSYL